MPQWTSCGSGVPNSAARAPKKFGNLRASERFRGGSCSEGRSLVARLAGSIEFRGVGTDYASPPLGNLSLDLNRFYPSFEYLDCVLEALGFVSVARLLYLTLEVAGAAFSFAELRTLFFEQRIGPFTAHCGP